jgi:hypothetical protein
MNVSRGVVVLPQHCGKNNANLFDGANQVA